MKSIIIPAKSSPQLAMLPDDPEERGTVLRIIAGGYIELAPFSPRSQLAPLPPMPRKGRLVDDCGYVNEDRETLGLPFNSLATMLCRSYGLSGINPRILGTMIILGYGEDGESMDVSEYTLRLVNEFIEKFPKFGKLIVKDARRLHATR